MKKIIYITLIIFSTLFTSCENENLEAESSIEYDGFYEIESMTSNQNVDLNNDSVNSQNLLEEIPNYFDNNSFDIEIRKLEKIDPFELLLAIYLPEPNELIDQPFSTIYYSRKAYFERINPVDNQMLLNNEFEINNTLTLVELSVMENDRISARLNQRFYDFQTNSWRNLDIEIRYKKLIE